MTLKRSKFRKCSGSEVNSKEQHPWEPVLPPSRSPFCPSQPTPRPQLPNPALPGGSPRAAPRCAERGAVNRPRPGDWHGWHPWSTFPHSLSGQREAPGTAHDTTWGLVTTPRRVAVRSVETTPRTKSERPSSPLCPGTQLWFQTGRVRKACLAYQTLKSCLST